MVRITQQQQQFPVALDGTRGVAEVQQISFEPFLGWQHTMMNPLTFNRIGFVALLAAFESGWLDSEGNFFTLAKYEQAPAPVEDQNRSDDAARHFSTVFVVSIESTIHQDVSVSLRGRSSATAVVSVSHVGSSSFTLGVSLVCDGATLGTMLLSFVHIDFKLRRPCPLPEEKRTLLAAELQKSKAHGIPASPIQRLPLAQLFASVAQSVAHVKSFALRQADFDFNLHLNQSMYQSFAMDALKEAILRWAVPGTSALTTQGTTSEWVRAFLEAFQGKKDDASPCADGSCDDELQRRMLHLDAHVVTLRVDYLKEIRMPPIATAVSPAVLCHVSPLPEHQHTFLFCIQLNTDAENDQRAVGTIRLHYA